MTPRGLGATLAIALGVAFAWRAGSPGRERAALDAPKGTAPPDAFEGERTAPVERPADPKAELPPPPPSRDIFRYAEAPSAPLRDSRAEPERRFMAPAEARAAPPALRFIGLVRRSQGLRAAVATASGVVIVGPGDVVLGHTVLTLDEDRGLRLRAPDGTELTLAPAN